MLLQRLVLQPRSWKCVTKQYLKIAATSFSSTSQVFPRNVAVIAHVDHGKTTLVDKLMCGSGETMVNATDRLMDSLSLEKERGISIVSKYTRVDYNGHVLNIVDTPGHAEFSSEVERVLEMVSGVLLVVDATEGPMAQTKFVLSKAIEYNLKPIVVINKVDRQSSRVTEVENEILDLFINLGAPDELLDYTVLYASAKQGWAVLDLEKDQKSQGMAPLLDTILQEIPIPVKDPGDVEKPFAMAVNCIQNDNYVGRVCMGKIRVGQVKVNDPIKSLSRGSAASMKEEGAVIAEGKVLKLFVQRGMDKHPITEAKAGDIIWLSGVEAGVSDTICAMEVTQPLFTPALDPPTLSFTFGVNDSPVGGKEGKFVTSTHVLDRLHKELENNVSISLSPSPEPESIEVFGRGELQIGILIEEMRREGYELSVSPPKVLTRKCPDTGKELEPIEEVTIDIDQELSGIVVEKLSMRKANLVHFGDHRGKSRLVFHCPSRGLLGFTTEIKTETRGSAVVNRVFLEYQESVGHIDSLFRGKLISMDQGKATAYALNMIEERGVLFISPGEEVYSGMIIGEHSRPTDLEVNPTRAKKMTNVRSVNADEAIRLAPPLKRSLEEYIAYMAIDEKLEITPSRIRLRKKVLDSNLRARLAKGRKA